MYQVPAADQQQVVDELRRAEHPCVVYNPGVAAFWLQHRPKPDRPLMNYIDNNFETVATIGAFQLQELRPGSRR
jgi:hypothetical protein